jgi:hypothetical protein
LRDRYDKVLRPSSFNQWRNRRELARIQVTFIHWMNEGRRTLLYLSRNTLTDPKFSCPDTKFNSGISSTSSGISSSRIYQRHLTSVSESFVTGFLYKEISHSGQISYKENPEFLPSMGCDPPTIEPSVWQIWPLGFCSGTLYVIK